MKYKQGISAVGVILIIAIIAIGVFVFVSQSLKSNTTNQEFEIFEDEVSETSQSSQNSSSQGSSYQSSSSQDSSSSSQGSNSSSNQSSSSNSSSQEQVATGSGISSNQMTCSPNDPPSITLLSPNGGETYNIGETVNFQWESCNVSLPVFIEIYNENTTSIPLVDSIDGTPNDGVESIQLQTSHQPTIFSGSYQVRISNGLAQSSSQGTIFIFN